MTFAEEQIDDLLNIIADNPVTFTFGGGEYQGMRGGHKLDQVFQDGGFMNKPDFVLVTTLKVKQGTEFVDRFPTAPTNGQKITIDGTDYRIDMVTRDEWGASIEFSLMSVHQLTKK